MPAITTPICDFGWKAPDFDLPGIDDRNYTLTDVQGENGTLVLFLCNHCPFVVHIREALAESGREYQERGVAIVAINSNDVASHPDDSPEKMAEELASAGYTFAYLYDESQSVAQAYRAACTPDFFVCDGDQRLA